MMRAYRGLLLTGATGFLGRYLLRELLLADSRVAVLVRDTGDIRPAGRIRELVAFWSDALGRRLPEPLVLVGDLRCENLGLTRTDFRWVSSNCQAVVHAAASVAFRPTASGEPFATNVEGTRLLLSFCRGAGLAHLHAISTAFVCGKTAGPVREDDRHAERNFHNAYEKSKWEAERILRAEPAIQTTIYRPSVIVGDSRTGYTTSYHGIYRFLELADRLAEPSSGLRRLPLRLPLTGDEPRNLVTVDWVAAAIVRLMQRPECHGRTYHLVSPEPTPARLIKDVGVNVLRLEGVELAGPLGLAAPTESERTFLDNLEEYWPYFHGDPIFDSANLRRALPELPPVRIDRALLTRLFVFALADRWGRGRRAMGIVSLPDQARIDCRRYVEEVFPEAAARSRIMIQAALSVTVALDITGPEGGRWTCSWNSGMLDWVRAGLAASADVTYRLGPDAFDDLIRKRFALQELFANRRIEILGNVEKAFKLSVLFGLFLEETPVPDHVAREAINAGVSP